MSFIVGLDIGTRSVAGAVFSGTSKKLRLVDFFVEDIPAMGDQAPSPGGEYVPPMSIDELLQKIVSDRRLQGAEVVAAVDAKDCIIREFSVPFTKEEQIRRMIKFEAESFFQTLDMENVILDYLKVGESNGKSQLVVTAVRNDLVDARLGLLKKAGLDPVALDLDAAALFNAFTLTPVYDAKKSTLLIDMGATSTKMVLIEGGQLKKIRSFRMSQAVLGPDRQLQEPAMAGVGTREAAEQAARGPADLVFGEYSIESRFQEIENALRKLEPIMSGDPAEEAMDFAETPIAILSDEDFARVHGGGASSATEEAGRSEGLRGPAFPRGNGGEVTYRAYLERLGAEIHRTFAASRSPIDIIVLTGGKSSPEEARRYLNEEFDVETIQLDFGDSSFDTDLTADAVASAGQRGAVAVGLAVKELGHDRAGLDFRQGRFRYEHRFARLKLPLLVTAVLAVFFFLQTAVWSYWEHLRLSERAANLELYLSEEYKAFFGKEVAEGRDPLAAGRDQKKKWEGGGVGDVGKVIDCVEAIRNCGEVLNSTNLLFTVTNFKFEFRVKPGVVQGGKKSPPRAEDSQVDLITDQDDAHLVIIRKFREPLSKVFDCSASSNKQQDGGFKVTLKLTPKPSYLSKLQ